MNEGVYALLPFGFSSKQKVVNDLVGCGIPTFVTQYPSAEALGYGIFYQTNNNIIT